ncbi:integrase core domain-containing protein [Dickeya oryzae]|uniref:integrase core domain-containing protein n=1 Tax=Dickeya oryzae TaxID=1240404 RepID=UPI0008FBE2DC
MNFPQPASRTDSATVEQFNDRLRKEGLNENCFMSLEDDRCKIEACRILYTKSPHNSAQGRMITLKFSY